MFLGQNIKKARLTKNLTQGQLADALNIGHSTISNWENGTNKPDAELIKNICIVLDIDANYLYDFDNAKKELEQNKTSIDRNSIFNIIEQLSKNKQDFIYNLLNYMIKEIKKIEEND